MELIFWISIMLLFMAFHIIVTLGKSDQNLWYITLLLIGLTFSLLKNKNYLWILVIPIIIFLLSKMDISDLTQEQIPLLIMMLSVGMLMTFQFNDVKNIIYSIPSYMIMFCVSFRLLTLLLRKFIRQ
jgi:hypothetical protein